MNDLTCMALAAQEAAKATTYKTFDNPRVGAIIVQNNQIIATGHHEAFGQAHAEINAFNHLKDKKSNYWRNGVCYFRALFISW
ncbi:hypothetical protein LKI_10005 [Leuconostoc kimchii IMSNU 11154]|uniref:CMP/dCMP-type deaminase domain-containing protein n=1 Tax=Leuconostoc kimchii (strain IMSNU 11154 / KCTC 2386 / IH25) TaxID=762051 RepID=D5T4R9_LEUKI|nr:deaminase [Leuconostoc kimchii]ADG41540.1 hypothetical protein LKI_10005 [Leuconostoc kimchii IMSNU 11154]